MATNAFKAFKINDKVKVQGLKYSAQKYNTNTGKISKIEGNKYYVDFDDKSLSDEILYFYRINLVLLEADAEEECIPESEPAPMFSQASVQVHAPAPAHMFSQVPVFPCVPANIVDSLIQKNTWLASNLRRAEDHIRQIQNEESSQVQQDNQPVGENQIVIEKEVLDIMKQDMRACFNDNNSLTEQLAALREKLAALTSDLEKANAETKIQSDLANARWEMNKISKKEGDKHAYATKKLEAKSNAIDAKIEKSEARADAAEARAIAAEVRADAAEATVEARAASAEAAVKDRLDAAEARAAEAKADADEKFMKYMNGKAAAVEAGFEKERFAIKSSILDDKIRAVDKKVAAAEARATKAETFVDEAKAKADAAFKYYSDLVDAANEMDAKRAEEQAYLAEAYNYMKFSINYHWEQLDLSNKAAFEAESTYWDMLKEYDEYIKSNTIGDSGKVHLDLFDAKHTILQLKEEIARSKIKIAKRAETLLSFKGIKHGDCIDGGETCNRAFVIDFLSNQGITNKDVVTLRSGFNIILHNPADLIELQRIASKCSKFAINLMTLHDPYLEMTKNSVLTN